MGTVGMEQYFKFDYLVFIFICNEFNERSVNNFQVQSLNW